MLDFGNDFAILGKLVLAIVLGGLVGYERETAQKPAGLRTHILVAATATLIISLGNVLINRYADREFLNSDPIRMFEAIIVGISFLGAGTIWRSQDGQKPVEGLTTAASILYTAVLGIGVAIDQYVLVIGATLIILVVNAGLPRLERWLGRER